MTPDPEAHMIPAAHLAPGDWFTDPHRGDWREVRSIQAGPLLDSDHPELGLETDQLVGIRTDRGTTLLWPDTLVEANPA